MNLKNIVQEQLAAKSAEQGILSFDSGIKNIVGARHTTKNIRLSIANPTSEDKTIYLMPRTVLGHHLLDEYFDKREENNIFSYFGLPKGHPFFLAKEVGAEEAEHGNVLTIKSLNMGQNLAALGFGLSFEPTQFTAISMKSYRITGEPENTNFGNSLTHYRLSHLEEFKRSNPLNFDAYQSSKDFSTEILKIDLIKNNFPGVITQNDLLAFQVNAGTRLTVTLHIGARLSMPEFFYRQVKNGTDVLLANFPNEDSTKEQCGC